MIILALSVMFIVAGLVGFFFTYTGVPMLFNYILSSGFLGLGLLGLFVRSGGSE